MENTQGKKPAEWFAQLKEPYRSQAIENIEHNNDYKSLYESLYMSFTWSKSPQGDKQWKEISKSIKAGETTYLEPEQIGNTDNLKPEQMESGKWYVVDTFLIKFKIISNDKIYRYKCYELQTRCDYSNNPDGFIEIQNNDIIRPATKEEVLKYFPDEVFEPIKLRPEDLKAGEVYRAKGTFDWIFIFSHIELGQVWHKKRLCLSDNTLSQNNGWFLDSIKFYHATPEEKKLLLGEEQTDWEAKYNELKVKYDDLKQAATESNIELNEKIRELETKQQGEKVYFYHDGISWSFSKSLDDILVASREDYEIYEAVCIGKKKSVLVSE